MIPTRFCAGQSTRNNGAPLSFMSSYSCRLTNLLGGFHPLDRGCMRRDCGTGALAAASDIRSAFAFLKYCMNQPPRQRFGDAAATATQRMSTTAHVRSRPDWGGWLGDESLYEL